MKKVISASFLFLLAVIIGLGGFANQAQACDRGDSKHCASFEDPMLEDGWYDDTEDWFYESWPLIAGNMTLEERWLEGNGGMDIDYFLSSGQAVAFKNSFKLQWVYETGEEPEVFQYWKDQGIEKVVVRNELDEIKWVAYIPEEALEKSHKKKGRNKKFPFIFQLPHADVFNAEGRGFAQLAADQRVIVVIPIDKATRNPDDLFDTYLEVVEMYPVDKSRFYVTGFSMTGFNTLKFAVAYPEIIAGISVDCHLWPFHWDLPEEEAVTHMAELKMPFMQYVGNADFAEPLPINSEFILDPNNPRTRSHVHTPQDNIDRANMWFKINDAPELSYEDSMAMMNSYNIIEREIGAPIERGRSRGKIESIDDTYFFFMDFKSRDGVYRTRLINMDNVPHFPWGNMAEVTWDFLKNFKRNIKTGKSITVRNPCF